MICGKPDHWHRLISQQCATRYQKSHQLNEPILFVFSKTLLKCKHTMNPCAIPTVWLLDSLLNSSNFECEIKKLISSYFIHGQPLLIHHSILLRSGYLGIQGKKIFFKHWNEFNTDKEEAKHVLKWTMVKLYVMCNRKNAYQLCKYLRYV